MDEIKISLDAGGTDGGISVVRVDGVIDTMTSSELEKVMSSLIDQARYNIVIDLGGVDYISSAGWGIFISNIREIRQNEGDLKLAGMIPNVYEIYELLEFDSILRAFENVEKAKSDFNISLLPEKKSERPPEVRTSTEIIEEEQNQAPAVENVSEPEIDKESTASEMENIPEVSSEEQRILDLAADDPFLSIREMKKILNSEAGDFPKLGWWKIRRILKEHDILSKKKRFRYARKK
ncbi:MAG: STAS domain-containing protein [candidate division Zixibacteria bacterium]|nr:STAS domain-containing protein [candidate division Zixibacteria bacterium]NIR66543.1 STAS domain-containing protein [candidate division Zixibacteria bacterium]NIS17866.1 STAS domain-containing protein [candidate division Zixibacteria bacterium]NIS48105.1 STAS domain-containing protein [candidate division Zixibacteria bacterium]NIT54154.1 STAS domain-containing protein [candidate division Zixibacteria bacterium]